jgi:hypothetical protein
MVQGEVPTNSRDVAQGLVVEARGNQVTIKNYDFLADQWIDQTWTFDVTQPLPYTKAARQALAATPQFANNAAIRFSNIRDDGVFFNFDQATIPPNTVGDIVHHYRFEFVNLNTQQVDKSFQDWSNYYILPWQPTLSYYNPAGVSGLRAGTAYELRIAAYGSWGKASETMLTGRFTTTGDPDVDPETRPPTFAEMRSGVPVNLLDVDFVGNLAQDHSPAAHVITGGNDNIAFDDTLGKPVATFNKTAAATFKVPWSNSDYTAYNSSQTVEMVIKPTPDTAGVNDPMGNTQNAGTGWEITKPSTANATTGTIGYWLHLGGSYKSISGTINYSQWNHVVGTYDGQRMRLYINGVKVSELAASGIVSTPSGAAQAWYLGADVSPSGLPEFAYLGQLSQAQIHDAAWTPQQVAMSAKRALAWLDNTAPLIDLVDQPAAWVTAGQAFALPHVEAADDSSAVTLTLAVKNGDVLLADDATVYGQRSDQATLVANSLPANLFAHVDSLTLQYTATDQAGHVTTVERTVAVRPAAVDPPTAAELALLRIAVDLAAKFAAAQDTYTPASFAVFAAVLAQAQAVLDDPTSAQRTVSDILADLLDAQNGLELAVDKTVLNSFIQAAQAIVDESANYLAGGLPALVQALTQAQQVWADPAATNSQVNAAIAALQQALVRVVAKGDPSLLRALVEFAGGLRSNDFTPSTWQEVATAVASSLTVLAADASTSQLDEAFANLRDAITGLVLRARTSALAQVVALAELIVTQSDDYLPSSIAGLAEELASAQTVLADADADQATVDQAQNRLLAKVVLARLRVPAATGSPLSVIAQASQALGESTARVSASAQPKLRVSAKRVKLTVGQRSKLTAKVTAQSAKRVKLTWSSSNRRVVQVSANGRLVAKKVGTANIKIKTSNGLIKTVKVTVK